MNEEPSTNGANGGRASNGRFALGNKLGRGNPFNKRACELRAALFAAVDDDGMKKAAEAILKKAIKGNVPAFKELLDRTIGKAVTTDILDRLAAIEAEVFGHENEHQRAACDD
jgi:hypothetical protein